MIWTAIFNDQTTLIFTTPDNDFVQAMEAANTISSAKQNKPCVYALIKGNHTEVKFF